MTKGRIILLNGTSSSGKTTLSQALQEALPEPYMHLSLDGLFYMYPKRFLNANTRTEAEVFRQLIPTVVSGLHHAAAALAKAGNNVIVDHVLQEDGWLQECLECWKELVVYFVGVKCDLSIVMEREARREDREKGLAWSQYDRVHRHNLYDIVIDTTNQNAEKCARQIIKAMANSDSYVFEILRQRLLQQQ